MKPEDFYQLVIGINRIFYEMHTNNLAYYSIEYSNARDHALEEMPYFMNMLQKNHHQTYIIEASKILVEGENHFLINKAVNYLKKIDDSEKLVDLGRQLKRQKNVIAEIKAARNSIFAHLDENYLKFKNKLNNQSISDLNSLVQNIINYINDFIRLDPDLDYRNFPRLNIIENYDQIFYQLVNTKIIK